ncbi:exopolysaccharide regulatory tyrosine autokinase VpsO [Opitutales bacterium ASA1]|uniref:GumC family protein n=1 Tax=Congregicoccus parvus TaxID=3081749 RepID=UPI002B30821B|nr:exopolysaccharide regulatory tyrosine autokinase VpsO [Opitutales bacterium ASA1]
MSNTPSRREPAGPATNRPKRARAPINTRSQPIIRSAKDYWVMFRERWYWGLLAALLTGGSLYYFLMSQPPVYHSGTTVLFENPVQPLDIRPVIGGGGGGGGEINLATHIEQLRSGSFRSYVAASFTPEEVQKIRAAYLDPEKSAAEQISVEAIVAAAIDIEERRDSPVLQINAFHRDPVAAELIANRFARRYIEYNLDQTATGTNSALIYLQEEERKLRQQFEQTQAKLQDYMETYNTVSLDDNQLLVRQKLDGILSEKNAAKTDRLRLETTLQQIEAYQKTGGDLIQTTYVSNFRNVPNLLREIDELKSERALLEQRYFENHPRMLTNTRALESKTAQLNENIAIAVAELKGAYERAVQHEQRLEETQRVSEREAIELQQISSGFTVLKKEADSVSALLDDVIRRGKETAITITLDNVSIKIMDRAGAASSPSEPKRNKVLVQAGGLGMVFFVALPVLLGMMDSRLKAAWEIEQFLEQNLLGEVPSINGVARKERAHIMSKDLDHAASEAFRGLFGQLQLNSPVAYPKVLMVTSTLPGEGKSVIANNLAATFASHGKKTVLIDCDFRRPNLHLFYAKDNACGVLRWLNAGGQLEGAAEEDHELGILPVKQNLFLLRAGGEHRRATELFETASFAALVESLRKQFDVVLIDTPPLGVFPDSMLISRLCDEIAYVCRFNTVPRSKIRKTMERLKQTTAHFSGIVLNGLPTGAQSAYYDYYGYGSNESKRYKAYYAQKR